MKAHDVKLMVVTKSDIVCRDIDILLDMRAAVSITLTSLNDRLTSIIEPGAPSPERRFNALKTLHDDGVPVVLRLDPVIPFKTEHEILEILQKCSFVDHVVSSTLKLRYDSLKRMIEKFPELSIYKELYLKLGERIHNSFYLPMVIRIRILDKVKDFCENHGISYGFCREGISFKGKSCDGTHLLK